MYILLAFNHTTFRYAMIDTRVCIGIYGLDFDHAALVRAIDFSRTVLFRAKLLMPTARNTFRRQRKHVTQLYTHIVY